MSLMDLEGDNLGEKHKHFNKLVRDVIENKGHLEVDEHNPNESDVTNLIKIDVANNNKNVDYIINALTCRDMLYVNRALKNCDWLISDDKYVHFINPEYLDSNIYPKMQTKAVIKLKQLIRLKLHNELRAEQFYNFEQKSSEALKWLPKCSITFIDKNFDKHVNEIDIALLKRLCQKSIIFLEKYIECPFSKSKSEAFEKTLFLLHVDINKYLDILETQPSYSFPTFGKRATKVLMTKCPKRIIDKFGKYCVHIDTSTFVKYLNTKDLSTFLIKEALNIEKEGNELMLYFSFVKNWNSFLTAMPITTRFEFVNQMFIDESSTSNGNNSYDLKKAITLIRDSQSFTPVYYWYQFVTFDIAFVNVKKMIGPETDAYDKNEMLKMLLVSAQRRLEHGICLLQYFREKHMNSSIETRQDFVCNFIYYFDTHSFDNESWKILEDIINTLDISSNSESNKTIIEALILYKILHHQSIPNEIENVFEFDSLKRYQRKLNSTENGLLFNYLQQLIWKKLQNIEVISITDFENCVNLLEKNMILLQDWNKNILDHPFVLDKIKQLINIKQEKSWTVNMSSLYNIEKSWRKYLFDQSLLLSPNEETCINSLKHRPNLLSTYKSEVDSMFFNNAVSFRRLFRKVRIYWPQCIHKNWKDVYLNNLYHSERQNALTKGLCSLLPKSELYEILKKHAPKDPKIDWDTIQEHELSLQRCFAKNMHNARPLPSLETVFLYAKGDYLQFALPSLLAVYYNMSKIQCQESVLEILDTPVSLQKHGIRFVFDKLSLDKLRETFNILWTKTKNLTIRAEIFKITHKLLCDEKDESKVIRAWSLLEMFIDNLTFRENKAVYKLLHRIDEIPQSVKASYLVKSYKFLKNLIMSNEQEYGELKYHVGTLALYSREIMESLPSEFVANIIAEDITAVFFKEKVATELLSTYLMCAKDDEIQIKKYNEVLVPILNRSFELWKETKNSENIIQKNIKRLLSDLIHDFKHISVERNMINPVNMFLEIQSKIERSLPLSENYILIRTWQLATKLVTLFDKNQPIIWEETCLKIAPEFGKICEEYLKEDTKSYFSCIYILFVKVFDCFKDIFSDNTQYEIYKSFVLHEDFEQGFLTALMLIKQLNNVEIDKKVKYLREKIREHPSVEIKMHYYDLFQEDRTCLFLSA